MNLLSIGIGSLFRTGVTAMLDSMGSTFPRAAVAALEDEKQSKVHLAKQCLIDEGPEVFWKTIIGSLFVKTLRIVTPAIPEQIANFPGEMLGASIHWWSAKHQSKPTQLQRDATNSGNKGDGIVEKFFDNCIKSPIDFGLKVVGLGASEKDEGNVNFFTFGAIQAALFAGGAYVLSGAEEENIPGMNLDYEDPWYVSFLKTAGYTVFEQIAHGTSQTIRYYMENYKEFTGKEKEKEVQISFNKDALAKTLANVINERVIPGNIPSAISGCLSTLFLGRFIPKSVAGAIGEAPMKALERLLTIHKKRATKDKFDESGDRVKNYRTNETLESVLGIADSIFDPCRNFLVNIVAKCLRPENISTEAYKEKLKETFKVKEETLKAGRNDANGKPTTSN